jgi:hypothetical protein
VGEKRGFLSDPGFSLWPTISLCFWRRVLPLFLNQVLQGLIDLDQGFEDQSADVYTCSNRDGQVYPVRFDKTKRAGEDGKKVDIVIVPHFHGFKSDLFILGKGMSGYLVHPPAR